MMLRAVVLRWRATALCDLRLWHVDGYGCRDRVPCAGRRTLNSAATGAPTVSGDVVFVVTRNAIGWAIDASNGRILWQVLGAQGTCRVLSVDRGPQWRDRLWSFPFASGQMVAAGTNTGAQAWAASVAGQGCGARFSAHLRSDRCACCGYDAS